MTKQEEAARMVTPKVISDDSRTASEAAPSLSGSGRVSGTTDLVRMELPRARVRGFDRLFKQLAEILEP